MAAATAVIAPFVIKFILAGFAATLTSSVALIVGGALLVVAVGWTVNEIATWLGIKQVIYDFLMHSSMAQVYRKQAEEDPEWIPWYF